MLDIRRVFVGLVASVVVTLSVAPAAAIDVPRGDPSAPEAPIPESDLPTAAESAAAVLVAWIEQNPSVGESGVAVDDDLVSINVYWKGDPPDSLRVLADAQSVVVRFRSAVYSMNELDSAAASLLNSYQSWMSSAGPTTDYNGLAVTLTSAAPESAMSAMQSQTEVPLVYSGVEDIEPTSRNADYAPWYGGSLIYNPSPSTACTTGAAVNIGTTSYVTTAWHCGPGTWRGFDNASSLGAVGPRNYLHDIELIKASSLARIWNGPWNTSDSNHVYAALRPTINMRVILSGGVTGTSIERRYVRLVNQRWNLPGQPNVGPGFVFGPSLAARCGGATCVGILRRGDSGGPVMRYTSGGTEVSGFLSATYSTNAIVCQPGHPNFGAACWARGRAVYASDALASLGAHIKNN